MNKEDIFEVIGKLDRNGYYYDDLESFDDNIRVCAEWPGIPIYFNSWEELKEWIDEVAEVE